MGPPSAYGEEVSWAGALGNGFWESRSDFWPEINDDQNSVLEVYLMKVSVNVKSVEFLDDTCVHVRRQLSDGGCIFVKMPVKEDFWKKLEAELKAGSSAHRASAERSKSEV